VGVPQAKWHVQQASAISASLFAPSKLICCGCKGTQSIKRECYNLYEKSQSSNPNFPPYCHQES